MYFHISFNTDDKWCDNYDCDHDDNIVNNDDGIDSAHCLL